MTSIWRKSSRSGGGEGAQCVEVADLAAAIGIRDSKNVHLSPLTVTRAAFAVIVRDIKAGRVRTE